MGTRATIRTAPFSRGLLCRSSSARQRSALAPTSIPRRTVLGSSSIGKQVNRHVAYVETAFSPPKAILDKRAA